MLSLPLAVQEIYQRENEDSGTLTEAKSGQGFSKEV